MIERLLPETPLDEMADLRSRIAATRWPDDEGDDWERGTQPSALRELLRGWAGFDWAAAEQRYRTEMHFLVGQPGERLHVWRSGTSGKPTLVLLHGWPDSFLRFRRVAELLSDDHDIIVPSLPGFGWSDPAPAGSGGPRWNARRIATALDALGVTSYVVHGGDLGTAIAEQLTLEDPMRARGLHLADVPVWRAEHDAHLNDEERTWLAEVADWESREGAYGAVQRTKPQTLAAGLTDSPAGLASWYLEKFQAWGEGDALDRIPSDLLAENLSLHWFTRTAGSAARVYFDRRTFPPTEEAVRVPTAFALFPHDIDRAPESFARRRYPVARFKRFDRGGHFGAMEHPELVADDLRAFAADISRAT